VTTLHKKPDDGDREAPEMLVCHPTLTQLTAWEDFNAYNRYVQQAIIVVK
jgi:hypothetical protein